jgi:precorrin-3B C17-methyltransferase
MLDYEIGMLTTVIIGNSATTIYDGLMITPRGYQRKYTLNAATQPLKPHQRLRSESEPWALPQEISGEEDEDTYDTEHEGTYGLAYEEDGTYDEPAEEGKNGTYENTEPAEKGKKGTSASLQLALEALQLVSRSQEFAGKKVSAASEPPVFFQQKSIFEFAVSPGIANKRFSARQMCEIGELVGEDGEIEYSPHHQLIVRISTNDPAAITNRLEQLGLLLAPIGDVAQIKACDFCNLEKGDSIPYAEEIHRRVGNVSVPKELKIGFNGCGMACYGAVQQDIGIVYRKEKFDLFLGGKTVGRNAHPAQPVAEGIEPERLAEIVERIVQRYRKEGHPNERFHKFFKRVRELEGYKHQEVPAFTIENALCGD